jgi:hypothetical protein
VKAPAPKLTWAKAGFVRELRLGKPRQTKISKTTPCKVAGGFERSLENILTRRANQGHYSIVADCSASAAINLPLHVRFDDGVSFLV